MNERAQSEFRARFGDRAAFDFPMARITTFRVGGPADCLVHVSGTEDLRDAFAMARRSGLPVTFLGAGSNLLVRDGGIRGLTVSFAKGFRKHHVLREGEREGVLRAEAGVKINTLLAFAQKGGWAGLEFLAGTPGTMGGAVTMNAGVRDREMKDVAVELNVMTPDGSLHALPRADLAFAYRSLKLPEGAVVCAMDLSVTRDDPGAIKERMTALLTRRKTTQPLSIPNAGSVFKNPPGNFAARLIEKAGLKGTRAGGAQISDLHANFIVNAGGARASDILALISEAKQAVARSAGVTLETEVRILGDDASEEQRP
ncbi:MAG: UDP-N-acetylmuramate dehydrogenase [Myxococcota bacterium]